MSDLAIKVENVSKAYTIWRDPSARLKHPFLDLAGELFPAMRPRIDEKMKGLCREFYALQDVSFEVQKGESVGIIGRNGSGKSTLLQIIAGTLRPTSGSVTVNGRVAALLELGSGFNPEFTGRENVFMNCSILGLTREQTERQFDDIAAFADIGDFLEQPVKTYSSGMSMRLAFAVAINTEPEILIIDEALSVGDELFQRKCFSRIEAIRKSGTTILFVSHSGGQIVELCERALLLDSGESIKIGPPKQVLGVYQKLLYGTEENRSKIHKNIITSTISNVDSETLTKQEPIEQDISVINESFNPQLRPTSTLEYESRGAIISNAEICTLSGNKVNLLERGKKYKYSYNVEFFQEIINPRYGMLIKTVSGFELGGAASSPNVRKEMVYHGVDKVKVEFQFECKLNPGTYFLNAGVTGIVGQEDIYLHRIIDACVFKVAPIDSDLITGIMDFSCEHLSTISVNK